MCALFSNDEEEISTSVDDELKETVLSPFSLPWKNSDAILVVDGRKLHVHISTLSIASEVFDRMFSADFKEKRTKTVELNGKKYETVEQMLKMIYPMTENVLDSLAIKDMDNILYLAQEFMIDSIRNTIEMKARIMSEVISKKSKSNVKDLFKLLIFVDKWDFHESIKLCAKVTGQCGTYYIKDLNMKTRDIVEQSSLQKKTKIMILSHLAKYEKDNLRSGVSDDLLKTLITVAESY